MRLSSTLSIPLSCVLVGASLTALGVGAAHGQSDEKLAPATPMLRVELNSVVKMKAGAVVRAHTIQPLYDENKIAIPAGALVTGKIAALSPASRGRRISAMSQGDFTPLHEATIQFDTVDLGSGNLVKLAALPAQDGTTVVRFQSPGKRKRPGLFQRLKAKAKDQKDRTVSTFTASGKMDRLKAFMFSQLPWHPEKLAAGTQYDVILARTPELTVADASKAGVKQAAKPAKGLEATAILRAQLQDELSSKTAKQGDAVLAMVTEPLLDHNGQIEIPQGATLRGKVLRARRSQRWGKSGALRFTFNQLDFSQGPGQRISGVPAAVDAANNGKLRLDAEGGVEPDSNKGLMAPLTLGLLATSALLDEDANVGRSAAASNGFGLVTRVVSIFTRSKIVAGTIGMAAAGRTVYTRFIAQGQDVVFPKNTQVEVEVSLPNHNLTPTVTPPRPSS